MMMKLAVCLLALFNVIDLLLSNIFMMPILAFYWIDSHTHTHIESSSLPSPFHVKKTTRKKAIISLWSRKSCAAFYGEPNDGV